MKADVCTEDRKYLVSIGEDNHVALRALAFQFPTLDEPEDAASLAARFEALAADHEPTHGNYFPHVKEEPDVHCFASLVAEVCRRHTGERLWIDRSK